MHDEHGFQVPEIQDPVTGRIDGMRLARYFQVDAEAIAAMLKVPFQALRADPSAQSIQAGLQDVAFVLSGLLELTASKEQTLIWLTAPHPVLDEASPIELMMGSEMGVVVNLVDDLLSGAPA